MITGYELKDAIVKILKNNNYEVVDFGTCDSKSVDYPDYGLKVAEAVKRRLRKA